MRNLFPILRLLLAIFVARSVVAFSYVSHASLKRSLSWSQCARISRATIAVHSLTSDVNNNEQIILSPFADENIVIEKQSDIKKLELTNDNVDKVLDIVRPHLIRDGGNVTVTEVNTVNRTIVLTLQGACGSCPSSTVSHN